MKKLILLSACILFICQALPAQNVSVKSSSDHIATRSVKYRVVINFISQGGGIDQASYEKIESFIKNYNPKLDYQLSLYGKEGEKIIRLKLSELTKKEQKHFVKSIKQLVVKPELVKIKQNEKEELIAKPATDREATVTTSKKCRLELSFISKGGGIDIDRQDKIKEFISSHPKKPAFEERHWGREGEVNYCFQLKELSADEQKSFISEIKKLISSTDMVLVSENP